MGAKIRIKTVFCNTVVHHACKYAHILPCARVCVCTWVCVCAHVVCLWLKPANKCIKCYCGGAGPSPEEVLVFDNALTRNALQASAKWACRCSGVGSQVWSVQFWPLRHLGGPSRSAVVQKEGKESERRERRRGFVCSCKLSLYKSEWVCVCVFPLRGGSERNATVPLHMSTPPQAATGPVENRHAPMTNTHRHTHTEVEEWKEVSNYTGRILIKTEEQSCPLRFHTFTP